MANHVHNKYTTSQLDAYRHPRSVPAYRYYTPERPQDFGKTYQHGEGTAKWFQGYHRSLVAEKTVKENLECIGTDTVVRPTWFSDKPNKVLGARCVDREGLFYRPGYKLFNRLADRERVLKQFVKSEQDHRRNYKDLSGTTHKVDLFHCPTEAMDQFVGRTSAAKIGDYPNTHLAALEYVWETDRGLKHYQLYHGTSDFHYHEKVAEV